MKCWVLIFSLKSSESPVPKALKCVAVCTFQYVYIFDLFLHLFFKKHMPLCTQHSKQKRFPTFCPDVNSRINSNNRNKIPTVKMQKYSITIKKSLFFELSLNIVWTLQTTPKYSSSLWRKRRFVLWLCWILSQLPYISWSLISCIILCYFI